MKKIQMKPKLRQKLNMRAAVMKKKMQMNPKPGPKLKLKPNVVHQLMTGTAAARLPPVDWERETVTLMTSVLDPSCVVTTTVKQGTTGWTAVRRGTCANQRMTGTAAPRSVRSNYMSSCDESNCSPGCSVSCW